MVVNGYVTRPDGTIVPLYAECLCCDGPAEVQRLMRESSEAECNAAKAELKAGRIAG